MVRTRCLMISVVLVCAYCVAVAGQGGNCSGLKRTCPNVALTVDPAAIDGCGSASLYSESTDAAKLSSNAGATGVGESLVVSPRNAINDRSVPNAASGLAADEAMAAFIAGGPQVTLRAVPSTISEGESATLIWESAGAMEVVGCNFPCDGLGGCVTVCPSRTTTYTITVRCARGQLATARARVPVIPGVPIDGLSVQPTSETSALVSWTTVAPTSSVVEFRGVIPPWDDESLGPYRRAVCYAPEEHEAQGRRLTPRLIDQDLRDILAANADAVNVYGLGGDVLGRPVCTGARMTLEEFLLARCRELRLRVIARLEWYPRYPDDLQNTFCFDACGRLDEHQDAEAVLGYHGRVFELLRHRYPHVLLYYLINLPLDDRLVQAHFPACRPFPTARELQDYVRYLRERIREIHPDALVRAVVHYSVLDNIPVPPLYDIVDGIGLVTYPGRCNSCPFTTGLPTLGGLPVDCGSVPSDGDGPCLGDPLEVIIGKDQLDYWLEKARATNGLGDGQGLAMDGVGFAPDVKHWSGIVCDHRTKVQAVKWLADYLFRSGRTDGFSYFKLHRKDEGDWGLVVPLRRAEDPERVRLHSVLLTDLSPGTRYTLWVVQGKRRSRPVHFRTPDPCPDPDWPELTITSPGHCGELVGPDHQFTVGWTSNLPAGMTISLYADPNDRGSLVDDQWQLDGTKLGDFDVAAGEAAVDLSGLRPGGYYIYGVVNVSHCSVPDGTLWDYSEGRVADPVGILWACPATAPPVIDGRPDDPAWSCADYMTFAVHPAENDFTEAMVKAVWDADFLYIAFDVSDTQVETNGAYSWDSDSVSVWLWTGTPPGTSTALPDFRRESRMGPCPGGSNAPWCEAACSLKEGTTCDDTANADAGYTVEMRIPWCDMHIVPKSGCVVSADLLSVDHDYNPGGMYNDPATEFSKVFWDDDGTGDWLGGAIVLRE